MKSHISMKCKNTKQNNLHITECSHNGKRLSNIGSQETIFSFFFPKILLLPGPLQSLYDPGFPRK